MTWATCSGVAVMIVTVPRPGTAGRRGRGRGRWRGCCSRAWSPRSPSTDTDTWVTWVRLHTNTHLGPNLVVLFLANNPANIVFLSNSKLHYHYLLFCGYNNNQQDGTKQLSLVKETLQQAIHRCQLSSAGPALVSVTQF